MAGNAVVSFAYTKDVIMSPAGAFYAVAVYVAVAELLERLAVTRSSVNLRALAVVVLTLTSTLWSVRAVGLSYGLREMAFKQRNDWVEADRWLRQQEATRCDPAGLALVSQLQTDAIERRVPVPGLTPRWIDRYVDHQP